MDDDKVEGLYSTEEVETNISPLIQDLLLIGKHISHLSDFFVGLDVCDVYIIYFRMSPVLYFFLQFVLSLNFKDTKVILL